MLTSHEPYGLGPDVWKDMLNKRKDKDNQRFFESSIGSEYTFFRMEVVSSPRWRFSNDENELLANVVGSYENLHTRRKNLYCYPIYTFYDNENKLLAHFLISCEAFMYPRRRNLICGPVCRFCADENEFSSFILWSINAFKEFKTGLLLDDGN